MSDLQDGTKLYRYDKLVKEIAGIDIKDVDPEEKLKEIISLAKEAISLNRSKLRIVGVREKGLKTRISNAEDKRKNISDAIDKITKNLGDLSYSKIANHLNLGFTLTSYGKKWTAESVRYILKQIEKDKQRKEM